MRRLADRSTAPLLPPTVPLLAGGLTCWPASMAGPGAVLAASRLDSCSQSRQGQAPGDDWSDQHQHACTCAPHTRDSKLRHLVSPPAASLPPPSGRTSCRCCQSRNAPHPLQAGRQAGSVSRQGQEGWRRQASAIASSEAGQEPPSLTFTVDPGTLIWQELQAAAVLGAAKHHLARAVGVRPGHPHILCACQRGQGGQVWSGGSEGGAGEAECPISSSTVALEQHQGPSC